jgi:hypothetical protein
MSSTPMTDSETQAIRDDLAFLRGLVQRGDDLLKWFGRAYFAAGVCYLGQTLLGLAQGLGWITTSNGPINLLISIGPSAVFVVALVLILTASRRTPAPAPGQGARAIAAVFGAIGLSNLALVWVIGSMALREKSLTIWLIYPCAVFILQGAAWLIFFSLRRQGWTVVVAAIWFGCALGMGSVAGNLAVYGVFAGIGLLFGMTVPGAWLMTRKSA